MENKDSEMLNTMIEFGTNYGSHIETALLVGFVGMIITTIAIASKKV